MCALTPTFFRCTDASNSVVCPSQLELFFRFGDFCAGEEEDIRI